MTVSDRPRRAWTSRLDPINWPSGIGIVLFAAWVAYAVASTVWLHLLLWTVLPAGLALYLFAERYPWPVIVIFVVPLTLLTAFAQVVATWADTPLWISFAIYLIACGYFSVVVSDPNRDRWTARLPRALLGEQFSARLAWTRFEASLVAANALVRQTNAGGDQAGRHAALGRLATQARRESRSRPDLAGGVGGARRVAGGTRHARRDRAFRRPIPARQRPARQREPIAHAGHRANGVCWTQPHDEVSLTTSTAKAHCFGDRGAATLCAWGNNTDCRR